MLKKLCIFSFILLYSVALHAQYYVSQITSFNSTGSLGPQLYLGENGVKCSWVENIPGPDGRWIVKCHGAGNTWCDFNCHDTACFYNDAFGSQLLNYAMGQMIDSVYTGSYNWNIINSLGTYLRSVSWTSDSTWISINVDVYITKVY